MLCGKGCYTFEEVPELLPSSSLQDDAEPDMIFVSFPDILLQFRWFTVEDCRSFATSEESCSALGPTLHLPALMCRPYTVH